MRLEIDRATSFRQDASVGLIWFWESVRRADTRVSEEGVLRLGARIAKVLCFGEVRDLI